MEGVEDPAAAPVVDGGDEGSTPGLVRDGAIPREHPAKRESDVPADGARVATDDVPPPARGIQPRRDHRFPPELWRKGIVAWYLGIPEAGKTWLALEHLKQAIRTNGWPALVIDTQGEEHFRHIPHARNVREAIEWVWGAGRNAAIGPHLEAEEVEALAQACLDPGHVNVLVDEAATWLAQGRGQSRDGKEGPLLRLIRTRRHAKCCLLLTTQHLTGDVPTAAISCAPRLYVFRCTELNVLDRLKREGVDPEAAKVLPAREYIEHYAGF